MDKMKAKTKHAFRAQTAQEMKTVWVDIACQFQFGMANKLV